jgi:hypothetical protein
MFRKVAAGAPGPLQFQYMKHITVARAHIVERYRSAFQKVRGLVLYEVPMHITHNHSYVPIRITREFLLHVTHLDR